MGIKSTVYLTRVEAIERYANVKADLARRKARIMASGMLCGPLEEKLEELLDRDARERGTVNTENFLISDYD